MELPEHVAENRRYWDAMAGDWVAAGERAWAQADPTWGIWQVPESDLGLLPGDMSGLDAIELGCGTGYVSAWMARRGARVTGVDISAGQLATARRLAALHGVELTLVQASAESVDAPDGSFDFAVSEYGAAIWCDPYVWIPEAHRLLRPGGTLVFLGNSTLATVCMAADGSGVGDSLVRDTFGLYRLDWRDVPEDPGGVEFNLPISGWVALFRRTGFEIVDFQEVRAPDPSAPERFFVSAAWSHRHPSEQVWTVRKR